MKRLIYIVSIGLMMAMTACYSEDSIKPDPELGEPLFPLERGEEGSLEEQIYSIYEKYGSFVLYDFNQTEFYTTWSSRNVRWYAPVKEGNESYVSRMLTFIQENVFDRYPEAFISKFLPYKIYLVDSLCDNTTYLKSKLVSTLGRDNHGLAVSHVGPDMDGLNASKWEGISSGIISIMMGNIYDSMDVPEEFFKLSEYRSFYFYDNEEDADPEGEFDTYHYVLYSLGFVDANGYPEYEYFMGHKEKEDLADYISFVMSTPKTDMDKIFARFGIVKKKAFLIAGFIRDEMEMDPIALQNSFCPNDPLPAGYFDEE